MIKTIIFIIFLFIISGCIDKQTIQPIDNFYTNKTSEVYNYVNESINNISINSVDICIKLNNNNSCLSELKNITMNISN